MSVENIHPWHLHQVLGDRFAVSGEELRYNLVGLHTCGDLGPLILHMFAQVRILANPVYFPIPNDS